MKSFELVPPGLNPKSADHETLQWPSPESATYVISDLDWTLAVLGEIPAAAQDLFHIASAAYLADLRSPRPQSFAREIEISVPVYEPGLWTGASGECLLDLLAWLSGDQWTLRPTRMPRLRNDVVLDSQLDAIPPQESVMLLSGGLDSFCGAVDQLQTSASRLHIGHKDSAKSVRHAQGLIGTWLDVTTGGFAWRRHELAVGKLPSGSPAKVENTTRTRSLLFMTMAIAAALGSGARTVVVPENGSTSMNVPLVPSRGGSFSTKSTHPWTFYLLGRLLESVSIDVEVVNPYIGRTKGQLLAQALKKAPAGFLEATGDTLSCAKLDSRTFRGGNANLNCGLCYACLVRRGAYLHAGVSDPTEYLLDRVKGSVRRALYRKRHDDLWALEYAEKRGVTADDLRTSAAWPPGYDIDRTLALVRAGRRELFSVPR